MVTLDRLDHMSLQAGVVIYRDLLRSHRDRLNRLNVYPVPDGDTGTNMALTLESVVAELESGQSAAGPPGEGRSGRGMADTCRLISRGSLMGARGNSGVILSQILRGLCGSLAEVETVDGPGLAAALGQASAAAYTAVMAPVEGTILTVVREAFEAAAACGPAPLVEVVLAARDGARAAVDATP
ncbi:MAG: DAK2 domain-containing protein, partial [Pseudonocardiaceae bacterium]